MQDTGIELREHADWKAGFPKKAVPIRQIIEFPDVKYFTGIVSNPNSSTDIMRSKRR